MLQPPKEIQMNGLRRNQDAMKTTAGIKKSHPYITGGF